MESLTGTKICNECQGSIPVKARICVFCDSRIVKVRKRQEKRPARRRRRRVA